MADTTINSTELDFEAIRNSLKTFFAQSDQFKDYNFDGSGLSNILDVLAYNTHYNALTANMAINESFLETAQLRASVITHALSLGYFPRSRSSAVAVVNLSVNLSGFVGTRPSTVTLPAGTTFSASVEGVSYTFQTREAVTGSDDGFGSYTFLNSSGSANIRITEGVTRTKTFFVPQTTEKQLYVIPDVSMDTTTATVRVYSSPQSTSYVSYSNLSDAIRIDADSKLYLLKESPNGYYELQFGSNNEIGAQPATGNKIVVTYLASSGAAANGAKSFSPNGSLVVSGQAFTISATTVSNASAGAARQSIDSIRLNAPLNYASQRRAVTKNDYVTLIQSKYPSLNDVITWGGEENEPVDYGKIYISINYPDDFDSDGKNQTKAAITSDIISPLGTMSISPVYIDPEEVYLGLAHQYDFNPNLTNLTSNAVSSSIINKIDNYFATNLEKFGKTFRRSRLLAEIDDLNDAILSSVMEVTMIRRFTPSIGVDKSYTIDFPVDIALTDDVNRRITSSTFTYNNLVCRLVNEFNTNNLQIVDEEDEVVERNVGSYNGGRLSIASLSGLTAVLGGNDFIKIKATPANQASIKPLRNYILTLDLNETTSTPIIDYQNTRVTL